MFASRRIVAASVSISCASVGSAMRFVRVSAGRRSMSETVPYTEEKVDDALQLVVSSVERAERDYHDEFVRKVEKRYQAYRGLIDSTESDDPSEDWRSEVTTPYVLQTCEGMLATMLEPSPRFNVQPRPRPEETLDEVLARVHSVDSLADTLRYALERDRFPEKQRDFMQQDLIAGLSVLKSYWRAEKRKVTKLGSESLQIADPFGQVYDQVTVYSEQTSEDEQLIWDDACCEVVDVRDFFWPGEAASIDKAEFLVHRTWESYDSLKRKAKEGIYRTRNLIEVLEYWTPERTITVGGRRVTLKDRTNPLWNGRVPFIVCSSMPDAFSIPGISVVEALAQLQEMLWTLQNQRLDVVRMLANLITLIRTDVDDPESFEWAPNAQWFVEDPGQVDTLKIDPTVASITLQAEAMVKGDLQNIMGGLPYASGADSTTIDQQTATGVSIITTIAQRIIQARKQQYLWAYAKLGRNFLLLYQQFLRDDRVVAVVGRRGAEAYRTISPLEIQGDFDVTIDVTSDSLVRQERRAEAQSLLTMAGQLAPIMAQTGAALNLRAFMEGVLDAYDVPDKERYFMPRPVQAGIAAQTPPPGAAPQPQQNGAASGPAPATNGVTNVTAAAGPLAPSHVQSMSPEASMQRLMAQRGGPANAG